LVEVDSSNLGFAHLRWGWELLQHAIGNEALIDAAEGIHESLQNALGLHYDLRKLLQGTPTAELLCIVDHYHVKQRASEYSARRAAYDLKKLRGKMIVQRIEKTHRYQSLPKGLRAMAALVLLRNKAIKPLLAAAQQLRPSRGPHKPQALDAHYETIPTAMQGVFQELGLAA
jgi:hypothetical protein